MSPQTLEALIGSVESSVLSFAVAPPNGMKTTVSGLTIYDPMLGLSLSPGHLLLGVGIDPATSASLELVSGASSSGFAALVLHADGELPEQLVAEAKAQSVPVLVAPVTVGWARIASLLRLGLAQPSVALPGVPLGDLFAFANALATRLHGSVTIEDPGSHVLAYSSVGLAVDEPRKQTILSRRVPKRYRQLMRERGVFKILLTSDQCVEIDAIAEHDLARRVAISVRGAGEVLGSIWVAQVRGEFAADYVAVMEEAAQSAALHITRHYVDAHAESNLRRSMVRDLIDGHNADVAAVRLGLDPEGSASVLALEAVGSTANRNRLREVTDLFCAISGRTAEVLEVAGRVYVVLTAESEGSVGARRFAHEASRRAGHALHTKVVVAVGPVLATYRAAASRREADRVLRVLLRPSSGRLVADLDEVRATANLLEVLDFLRERPHLLEGPLDRLQGGSAEQEADLVSTLFAYLDHHGDVRKAAQSLSVHPNTFRYRLRRAQELGAIDITDPAVRLMLSLQLRAKVRHSKLTD